SCGWVALCERRRAGFARLSGWQPVGNWGYRGRIFQHPCYPQVLLRQRAEESPTRSLRRKMARSQAEQVVGVRVFSSQEGAETIPRSGVFFYRVWGRSTMARRASAASISTNGSAARRQQPDPASEAPPQGFPWHANRLALKQKPCSFLPSHANRIQTFTPTLNF